jgi:hypothetical protein
VLYIQQLQRNQEPSTGFLDYFRAREPEKVIIIGGIEYASIYPIPFHVAADPQVSFLPERMALLGYSWEETHDGWQMRIVWENLGNNQHVNVPLMRLVGKNNQTQWTNCQLDPAFSQQAQTPGGFVESLCQLNISELSATTYTVEFALSDANLQQPFLFPEGWQSTRITSAGMVTNTTMLERLTLIVNQSVPAEAQRINRIYDESLRVVAYKFNPPQPEPGNNFEITLYWQPVKKISTPIRLTIQLADSRAIPLGRQDVDLLVLTERWLPGAVISTQHEFTLPIELDTPLAGLLELKLHQAEIELPAIDMTTEKPIDVTMAHFTIISPLKQPDMTPLEATWRNNIKLRGYHLPTENLDPNQKLPVTVFFEATEPITDNYMVFVHLVDEHNQIISQNDSLPRAGAYPTQWWLPGLVIADTHLLQLPDNLPPGDYRLLVGLYQPEQMTRLLLTDGQDNLELFQIQAKGHE